MGETQKSTPILIVFFNRPDCLRRNIRSLASFRPDKIFFSCDGPRSNRAQDLIDIKACKEIIREEVSWDCAMQFYYAEVNYGCDVWVPKAVSWFFSNVENGIILEDDCIIDVNFYTFASQLLEYYQDSTTIMNISAANFIPWQVGVGQYFFSRYPSNWGWATWRRAWKFYDHDIQGVEIIFNRKKFELQWVCAAERSYWLRFSKKLFDGRATYWDAKWLLSIWKNNGISITPNINLVTNIGVGTSATHTSVATYEHFKVIENISENLGCIDPPFQVSTMADLYTFKTRYRPNRALQLLHYLKKVYESINNQL